MRREFVKIANSLSQARFGVESEKFIKKGQSAYCYFAQTRLHSNSRCFIDALFLLFFFYQRFTVFLHFSQGVKSP
jgi:hypothetical protein